MVKWILFIGAVFLLSGCLGRLNPNIFPTKPTYKTITCGKNFDMCTEKASYHCGFRGYKIKHQTKTDKGYTIEVECNR
ncbi:hypothetical protein [Nitratiruptor sp. YY09-18]|uniref:hypothetical protein n=1 Tax=Nitratiruptor sp. YY09-18 TaxID=2724901 RepID=UPI001915D9AF|nr:hypothetical protein [Nitratiruptor sp. YY09-18]BCD68221.1 hypothetical protein NitYY0918_C1132 [Nitratiruptor sp. YY09-18]